MNQFQHIKLYVVFSNFGNGHYLNPTKVRQRCKIFSPVAFPQASLLYSHWHNQCVRQLAKNLQDWRSLKAKLHHQFEPKSFVSTNEQFQENKNMPLPLFQALKFSHVMDKGGGTKTLQISIKKKILIGNKQLLQRFTFCFFFNSH